MRNDDFSLAQTSVLDQNAVDATEHWIELGHGEAHVLATGEGSPVVLINGIGTPAAMFAPLMARLGGVQLVAIDLPGFGLTDATIGDPADLRASAVAFLDEVFGALGLHRPVIVSNSLGSLIASWLALDCPNRAGGLVHVGWPAVALDTSAPLPMRMLSVRPVGRVMTRIQPPSRRQVGQLSKMVREHPLPDDIADLIVETERLEHFRPTFLATLHHLLRLRGNRPERALGVDELRHIDQPTLLVLGRDDPFGSLDDGRRLVAAMPNAVLEVVDGGHAPWVRHADRVASAVNRYLRDQGHLSDTSRSGSG